MSLTQTEIENELRAFGLARGDAVEVHSSLRSFGWVEGGAATVVDALMSVVGAEGALVMSAYPLSKPLPLSEEERDKGIVAKVLLYGEDYDGPTGMGAIADEFRQRPGTVLGPGFHRVCAWGRDAALLSHGYARLLDIDGWVLLLGVDITRCSSMHLAEAVGIPAAISAMWAVPEHIRREYPEDVYIAYGMPPDEAWKKIQAEAEACGLIARRTIGQAECRMFRAKPVVALYEQALRSDPYGLFDVAPEVHTA